MLCWLSHRYDFVLCFLLNAKNTQLCEFKLTAPGSPVYCSLTYAWARHSGQDGRPGGVTGSAPAACSALRQLYTRDHLIGPHNASVSQAI